MFNSSSMSDEQSFEILKTTTNCAVYFCIAASALIAFKSFKERNRIRAALNKPLLENEQGSQHASSQIPRQTV